MNLLEFMRIILAVIAIVCLAGTIIAKQKYASEVAVVLSSVGTITAMLLLGLTIAM